MFEKFLEKDTSRWRIYGLSIIGTIVLISIVWLINSTVKNNNNTDNFQSLPNRIVIPKITRVNPEEVVERFPKELILNSETKIIQSHSATYPNSSVKQETVVLTTLKNVKTNYNFYLDWSKRNNWSIINSSEKDNVSLIYLRKGAEDINITITTTHITISHINK